VTLKLKELVQQVQRALEDGGFEGAIETVFEAMPELTRDEAVDFVEQIETLVPKGLGKEQE
jgi:hypothetical protein